MNESRPKKVDNRLPNRFFFSFLEIQREKSGVWRESVCLTANARVGSFVTEYNYKYK